MFLTMPGLDQMELPFTPDHNRILLEQLIGYHGLELLINWNMITTALSC